MPKRTNTITCLLPMANWHVEKTRNEPENSMKAEA